MSAVVGAWIVAGIGLVYGAFLVAFPGPFAEFGRRVQGAVWGKRAAAMVNPGLVRAVGCALLFIGVVMLVLIIAGIPNHAST